LHPEIVLDTLAHDAEANARRILAYLEDAGYVRPAMKSEAAISA
jgi:hypothetical protein